jgi:hypothetical protein
MDAEQALRKAEYADHLRQLETALDRATTGLERFRKVNQVALEALESGLSLRESAKVSGVSKSTLHRLNQEYRDRQSKVTSCHARLSQVSRNPQNPAK